MKSRLVLFAALGAALVAFDGTSLKAHSLNRDLEGGAPSPVVKAKFECRLINNKLVCGDSSTFDKPDTNGDKDNNGNGTNTDTSNAETAGPGEHCCPIGYVVLEKPNKFGAICEPKEGLPGAQPSTARFACGASVSKPDGTFIGGYVSIVTAADMNAAFSAFADDLKNVQLVAAGQKNCAPIP
jgi:hypothetical protein